MPDLETRLKTVEEGVTTVRLLLEEIKTLFLGDFKGSPSLLHQHQYHVEKVQQLDKQVKALERAGGQRAQKIMTVVLSVVFSSLVAWAFRKL